jgi:Alkylmercury lyase
MTAPSHPPAPELAADAVLAWSDDTLDRACRLLFGAGEPLPVEALAAELGQQVNAVAETIEGFEQVGRIRRDAAGRIVASSGVSVIPADYTLMIGKRVCWAWCAKTGLGVLGALGAGGQLSTRCQSTGDDLTVHFTADRPEPSTLAVLWPSDRFQRSCHSAADELCTTLSLFASDSAAHEWAQAHGVDAEVLTVAEATGRAVPRWRHSLGLPATREELLGRTVR